MKQITTLTAAFVILAFASCNKSGTSQGDSNENKAVPPPSANKTDATATTNAKAEEYKQTDLPLQAELSITKGGGFSETVGEGAA